MCASARADSYFVYIVRCADGSLYVGHASNVEERVKVHNQGRGALWTSCRRPVTLVYKERHASEAGAIARERQIKRWARALNLVCRLWQRRRRKVPVIEHVATVIQYHQARNLAAKRSRLRSVLKLR